MRQSRLILLALLVTVPLAATPAAEPMLYRIELAGNQVVFAKTPPVPHGTRIVFSRYPDGALMSLKRADVRRVVSTPIVRAEVRRLKPGELLVLGPTGEGAGTGGTSAGGRPGMTRPGEAPDGKALLNPQRDYRPEWDSKQVPGQNLAFPASPSDYREGRTFAYPPGSAVQAGPGQPPTGVPSGQPPKSP
jgi:hypothetical protein